MVAIIRVKKKVVLHRFKEFFGRLSSAKLLQESDPRKAMLDFKKICDDLENVLKNYFTSYELNNTVFEEKCLSFVYLNGTEEEWKSLDHQDLMHLHELMNNDLNRVTESLKTIYKNLKDGVHDRRTNTTLEFGKFKYSGKYHWLLGLLALPLFALYLLFSSPELVKAAIEYAERSPSPAKTTEAPLPVQK